MTDYLKIRDNFKKYSGISSICIRESAVKDAKFTIAIPTYKRAQLLKESIDSALAQQNCCEFIVMVVDNNPERDDETEKLIGTYNNDNLCYYKNSENIGMAGNWNRMFELSSSQWTVMLHDDDIISPYYIQTMQNVVNDNMTLIKSRVPKFYNKIKHSDNQLFTPPTQVE